LEIIGADEDDEDDDDDDASPMLKDTAPADAEASAASQWSSSVSTGVVGVKTTI